jgi:hypothetical protein
VTALGYSILLAAGLVSFTLALVIVLAPMNLFVRASLISLGFSGWFLLPFVAPGHEVDIGGAFWFGVALWAVLAWVLGLTAAVLTRFLWAWRRGRQHSTA